MAPVASAASFIIVDTKAPGIKRKHRKQLSFSRRNQDRSSLN
jgi:hypothetical protein